MWKCKKCGAEIKFVVSEAKMFSINKLKIISLLKCEKNIIIKKYVCSCSELDNDIELEDIATWED